MYSMIYWLCVFVVSVCIFSSFEAGSVQVDLKDRVAILVSYFAAVSSLYVSILSYMNSKRKIAFRVKLDSIENELVVKVAVNNQLADFVEIKKISSLFFKSSEHTNCIILADQYNEIERRLILYDGSIAKKLVKAKKQLSLKIEYTTTESNSAVFCKYTNPFYTPLWPKIAVRDVIENVKRVINEKN